MQFIPIDEITIQNNYLRTDTEVEKLKKSIQTVGLINPLTINDKKELIAGGRRFKALKELGYKEIPVNIISDNSLKQELISIDENLVRQDLNKIEMERYLNRGREIYEELFPSAIKVEQEDVTKAEGQKINEDLPDEKRSFLDLTAEKTGLSKKSIKQAINRDAKSSDSVKKLRSQGELNASQANELIRLDKSKQDEVVEFIKDKPAKEVRKFVEAVASQGIQEAFDRILAAPSIPTEYQSIYNFTKRINKLATKVLLEEMTCEHQDISKIIKSLNILRKNIDDLILLHSEYQNNEKDDGFMRREKFFSEDTIELNPPQ